MSNLFKLKLELSSKFFFRNLVPFPCLTFISRPFWCVSAPSLFYSFFLLPSPFFTVKLTVKILCIAFSLWVAVNKERSTYVFTSNDDLSVSTLYVLSNEAPMPFQHQCYLSGANWEFITAALPSFLVFSGLKFWRRFLCIVLTLWSEARFMITFSSNRGDKKRPKPWSKTKSKSGWIVCNIFVEIRIFIC